MMENIVEINESNVTIKDDDSSKEVGIEILEIFENENLNKIEDTNIDNLNYSSGPSSGLFSDIPWLFPAIVSNLSNATAVIVDNFSGTTIIAGTVAFTFGTAGGCFEAFSYNNDQVTVINNKYLRPYCTSYISDQLCIPAGSYWYQGGTLDVTSGVAANAGYFFGLFTGRMIILLKNYLHNKNKSMNQDSESLKFAELTPSISVITDRE